jgi:hypothetical protein
MPYIQTGTTVATTATLLVTIPAGNPNTAVTIQNNHSAAIFLGDSTVTATTAGATGGISVAAAGSITLWLQAVSSIYGISDSATATGVVKVAYSTVV